MKLVVTTYKKNGKFYLYHISPIEIRNWDDVFNLQEKIKQNDLSIHKFSPVTDGFNTTSFNFVIELLTDDFKIHDVFYLNFLLT